MRGLITASLIIAAVGTSCPKRVVVNGPKTAECAEGRYLVTLDETKDPPEGHYKCEKPTVPTASPLPSPTPSAVPSAAPTFPPSPSPSPVPSPSASPSSSPSPSPTTGPEFNDPDHVTIGDKPHNQFCGTGGNRIYVFNTTPREADGRPCQPPDRGCMYSRPEIRAWGPGFNGDEVVRSSRTAEPWEFPCPPDDLRCYKNHYLPRMVIGPDGSPAGHYTLRAAPRGQSVTGPKSRVREFELRDCK